MNFIFPVLGYICGSIPFGLILSKLFGYGDIRAIGSGNIGATNVLRTGNKFLAAAVLFLDFLKGALPVVLSFSSQNVMLIFATGLLAIIGHLFPIWLKFKGGKGVATSLGVLTALLPPLGLVMMTIWLITALVSKFSSLAALIAFALAPVFSFLIFADNKLAVLSALIALIVFWKHKENIKRLIKGEEPKINFKGGA